VIDVSTHAGLCDRALIGLMVFRSRASARLLAMKVEDVFVQNRRPWVGCARRAASHEMPCHRNLETYLHTFSTALGSLLIPRGRCFV
jgi:integrase/recombinase XerC